MKKTKKINLVMTICVCLFPLMIFGRSANGMKQNDTITLAKGSPSGSSKSLKKDSITCIVMVPDSIDLTALAYKKPVYLLIGKIDDTIIKNLKQKNQLYTINGGLKKPELKDSISSGKEKEGNGCLFSDPLVNLKIIVSVETLLLTFLILLFVFKKRNKNRQAKESVDNGEGKEIVKNGKELFGNDFPNVYNKFHIKH